MAKQTSARASQLKADFGTLRSTFFDTERNMLDLQGEKYDLSDESRRALRAIDLKMRNDQMAHTYKLANIQLNNYRRQMKDQNIAKTIGYGFSLLGNVNDRLRDRSQIEELREKLGLGSESGFDTSSGLNINTGTQPAFDPFAKVGDRYA